MNKDKDKVLGTHTFDFDPKNNGGESLSLTTRFLANGDPGGVFLNQELTLQSYSNSATFELYGTTFTPDILRKLANELEKAMLQAEAKTMPAKQVAA